jgi:hypothetical protein
MRFSWAVGLSGVMFLLLAQNVMAAPARVKLHKVMAAPARANLYTAMVAPARLKRHRVMAAPAQAKLQWAPLTTEYVESMYSNKTWMWKNGAGYFGADHHFKAWTRSKGVVTRADGTWDVRDEGMMCFSARWGASVDLLSEAPVKETCFSHSAKGRKIAQMSEPDGKWYIFKHARTRKRDEFLKLRPGERA